TTTFTSISPFFFFSRYGHHPHLHSFPTRRSSDLPLGLKEGSALFRFGFDPEELRVGSKKERSLDRGERRQRAALDFVSSELRERSEEHTSELQSRGHLVCRLLLEKKKQIAELTTP